MKHSPEQFYCVYNKTRETFLALSVTRADTHLARMKGLLGTFRLDSNQGVWIIPSSGVHSVGLRFPIDLIYLDVKNRVIETIESFGTFRIGPLRLNCESVLELSTRTIFHSRTRVGDELVIQPVDDMAEYIKSNIGQSDSATRS